ncbi:hypothetical protein V7078_19125 [Bacillus velezensis]|uniref:hypothetical protein n=1 Tax=Bacillus velezensis TaxID=492670 RepID=UPI002FFE5773
MNKNEVNLNSPGQQIIISGLAMLIEDEGYSTREAFQLLETIKRSTFHALLDIEKESKSK